MGLKVTVHSNPGTGSSGPCTPQKDQTPSHVCSGGGLTQGRETESFLGSHLSPGPLLGSKQQKEEKRTVIKVRKFKGRHVKGVYSSATRITQEEEEILSLNCCFLLQMPDTKPHVLSHFTLTNKSMRVKEADPIAVIC